MIQFLIYLLESSICLGICFLLFKLFFEMLTFYNWNRFMFWLLISCSIIIPALSIPIITNESEIPLNLNYNLDLLIATSNSIQSTQNQSVNLTEILVIIYFTGLLLGVIQLANQFLQIQIKLKKSKLLRYQNMNLVIHPDLKYASFFNLIFLPHFIPEDYEQQQILLHEQAHIKSKHSIDILIFQLLKIAFWFNPVMILLNKTLKEIHEFQADSIVTQKYSAIEYSKLILKLATQKHSLYLMNYFNYLQTQKRIVMMNKPNSKELLKSRFLFAIPVIGLLLALFAFNFQGISQQDLEGTWTGTNLSFKQTQGPDVSAVVEGGKALHIGGILILNNNNTYQIKAPSGSINGEGNWKMDTADTFSTTDSQGNATTYKIVSLESEKLVTTHKVSMDTPDGKVMGEITLSYNR